MEEEEPLGISLSISLESDDVHDQSAEQERGDLSYPSDMHSYISHIYIYTPCCFVLKEERQFCKNMYLWRPDCNCSFFLSLPFMVSAKHSGLKRGEKSDDPLVLQI